MVVVATLTGLIVHFVTKYVVNQKSFLSQSGSGSPAEHGRPLLEPAVPHASTGEDVELQPSPAYQAVSDYMPEYL